MGHLVINLWKKATSLRRTLFLVPNTDLSIIIMPMSEMPRRVLHWSKLLVLSCNTCVWVETYLVASNWSNQWMFSITWYWTVSCTHHKTHRSYTTGIHIWHCCITQNSSCFLLKGQDWQQSTVLEWLILIPLVSGWGTSRRKFFDGEQNSPLE